MRIFREPFHGECIWVILPLTHFHSSPHNAHLEAAFNQHPPTPPYSQKHHLYPLYFTPASAFPLERVLSLPLSSFNRSFLANGKPHSGKVTIYLKGESDGIRLYDKNRYFPQLLMMGIFKFFSFLQNFAKEYFLHYFRVFGPKLKNLS